MHNRTRQVRSRSLVILTALALAGTGGTVALLPQPVLAQTAKSAPALRVAKVTAPDDKSIDITFNKSLGDDLLQFTAANQVYAGQFIKVSGGTAGGSDAALDGRALSGISGTSVRPVDSSDHRTLRVVLGTGVQLDQRPYKLWLDGGGDKLADLFFRAADGGELPGSKTEDTSFEGTASDAAPALISKAALVDARTVDVTFATSIWSGMPVGAYTAANITLAGGGSSVSPAYVEQRAGTDRRTFRLYFGTDLDRNAAYELTFAAALKLTTSAGAATTPVTAQVAKGGTAYRPAQIAEAEGNASGDQIAVHFTHRIAKLRSGGSDLAVKETQTGVSGTTITAADVRNVLRFSGLTTQNGRDVAKVLREDAAYFPDASTLIVKLDSGEQLQPGSRGSVALRPGALTDITGAASTDTGGADVKVSDRTHQPDTGFDPSGPDYLKVETHATTVFERYDYKTSADGVSVRSDGVADKVVGQTIKTIVAENKYIKATFAPDYGGRMLSMIYKPTGHDVFYTNPVGTPYGFSSAAPGTPGNSPFYQNWLMVWGGVFPTLSEAEHGKYWNVPWDYKLTQTGDRFSIDMTKTDTVDYPYKPSKYVYGATGIQTTVSYSLTKDRPSVDMSVSLHNPGSEDKKYEYWTCTTLAPGASSHTGSPTMSIVSPVKKIYRDPGYKWMDGKEEAAGAPGDGMLKFDTLKKMSNWDNMGIAYGQDLATLPQGNWWGVINHENNEGVIRVGDNTKTPGLKLWEWGQNNSFDTNPYSKGNSARPYIELWAGASSHFFVPATLKAGQTLAWTETFLPTMDLGDVTNANANGAAHVAVDGSGAVSGRLFSTEIGQQLRATLVDAATGKTIDSKDFTGDAATAVKLSGKVNPGQQARLVLTDSNGKLLLTAESGL